MAQNRTGRDGWAGRCPDGSTEVVTVDECRDCGQSMLIASPSGRCGDCWEKAWQRLTGRDPVGLRKGRRVRADR